ncbi:MAG TPA: hypothetical protein VFN35_32285 [Ktedonobacteraceae bacterium]|nr:hypothetical protein [Ktedonobacteraceae bacterium]
MWVAFGILAATGLIFWLWSWASTPLLVGNASLLWYQRITWLRVLSGGWLFLQGLVWLWLRATVIILGLDLGCLLLLMILLLRDDLTLERLFVRQPEVRQGLQDRYVAFFYRLRGLAMSMTMVGGPLGCFALYEEIVGRTSLSAIMPVLVGLLCFYLFVTFASYKIIEKLAR